MAKRVPTRANPRTRETVQQRSFLARPSTRYVAAILALVLLAGIGGIAYLSRDAREVSVDDAVKNFRSNSEAAPLATAEPGTEPGAEKNEAADAPAQQQPGTTAAQPQQQTGPAVLPPPPDGVYVYATKGYEETDALAGQRHDYPSETTITNRTAGCTWTSRWQPLEERWEQFDFCEKPEGTYMAHYTMYHEFFQRGVRDEFTCDGFVYKRSAKPGDTWTFTCKSSNSTARSDTRVVGFEPIVVEGRTLQAMHIHYDVTATGANRGTISMDRWFTDEPRAMLRVVQKADLEVASPFGAVNYKESFRLDAKSLEPRT